MPRINDYDKWAIQWGYSRLPQEMNADEERAYLSKLVTDSVAANPRLWFGGEGRDFDPRSQTEDLGDNAVQASAYGIENLKRIVPELVEWSKGDSWDTYENLDEVYNAAVSQYNRYINHVLKSIGGVYISPQTTAEGGDVYGSVAKVQQKEALEFLDTHLFHEPTWLIDTDILNKVASPKAKHAVNQEVEGTLLTLLGGSRFSRMMFIAERYPNQDPYRPEEYLADIHRMVWKELGSREAIDTYRRHLQKTYVSNMIALYNPKNSGGDLQSLMAGLASGYTSNTDVRSLALADLLTLHRELKRAIPRTKDAVTKAHYHYLLREIDTVINTHSTS